MLLSLLLLLPSAVAGNSWNKTFVGELAFTHIPKIGGGTIIELFHSLVSHVQPRKHAGEERCAPDTRSKYRNSEIFAVSLRHPRAHVWSQFSQCRSGLWDREKFDRLGFPQSENRTQDFIDWIEPFHGNLQKVYENRAEGNDTWVSFPDFECYTPVNFMARALTCSGAKDAHHLHEGWPAEPDLVKAVTELAEHIDAVLILEFLAPSVCDLVIRFRGSEKNNNDTTFAAAREHYIQTECRRDCGTAVESLGAFHRTSAHTDTMLFLDAKLLEIVDEVTKIDRQVYVIALVWFFQRMKYHEEQFQETLICQDTLHHLREEFRYLNCDVVSLYEALHAHPDPTLPFRAARDKNTFLNEMLGDIA